jgi:hypothetical protein
MLRVNILYGRACGFQVSVPIKLNTKKIDCNHKYKAADKRVKIFHINSLDINTRFVMDWGKIL